MIRKLVLVALVALSLGACIPAEPDDDLIRDFDPEETVMGAIQERGTLQVGFDEAMPPDLRGFVSNLGREVSEALGVDVEYATATTEELLSGITDDTFDLAFPLMPITEGRVDEMRKTHGFTDPYLVAHQRLLIGDASLATGGSVCEILDHETGLDLTSIYPEVERRLGDWTSCMGLMEAGDVDAVTGPDIVLAGMLEELPGTAIVGDQLNTEGYGAVVEAGANAWTDYVSQVLEEAQQEGRWTDFFNASFAETLGSQDPPGMSAEEAAALFPSDVAL